jgi:hypothetical protein
MPTWASSLALQLHLHALNLHLTVLNINLNHLSPMNKKICLKKSPHVHTHHLREMEE